MGHHSKTLKLTDHIIEEIFSHIYTQSWMNITNFENWQIGMADDAEAALEWHNRNSSPAPRYFKAYDCKSVDNAKMILEHFHQLGVPKAEETYEGPEATSRFVYVYKTFI